MFGYQEKTLNKVALRRGIFYNGMYERSFLLIANLLVLQRLVRLILKYIQSTLNLNKESIFFFDNLLGCPAGRDKDSPY